MSLVSSRDLSLAFGADVLFDGASFAIGPHDRIGLVGPNGTGKSSLLRILAGERSPDGGTLVFRRGLAHRLPAAGRLVPPGGHHRRGGALLGPGAGRARGAARSPPRRRSPRPAPTRSGWSSPRRWPSCTTSSPTSRSASAATGPSGSWAASASPPTGSTAPPAPSPAAGGCGPRWPGSCCRTPTSCSSTSPPTTSTSPRWPGSRTSCAGPARRMVLVSHDRLFLNRQIDRVLSLEPEGVKSWVGDYDDYRRLRAEEEEQLVAKAARIEARRAQLSRFIERFGAKNTKATQAKSKQKMLDRMETVELPEERDTALFRFPDAPRSGREVLRLEGLSQVLRPGDGLPRPRRPGAPRRAHRRHRAERRRQEHAPQAGRRRARARLRDGEARARGAGRLLRAAPLRAGRARRGRRPGPHVRHARPRPHRAADPLGRGAGPGRVVDPERGRLLPLLRRRGRQAGRRPLRRRAVPGGAGQAAAAPHQLPAPRRAHQPPRHRVVGGAHRGAGRLRRDAALRLAQPELREPAGHGGLGGEGRRGRPLPGQPRRLALPPAAARRGGRAGGRRRTGRREPAARGGDRERRRAEAETRNARRRLEKPLRDADPGRRGAHRRAGARRARGHRGARRPGHLRRLRPGPRPRGGPAARPGRAGGALRGVGTALRGAGAAARDRFGHELRLPRRPPRPPPRPRRPRLRRAHPGAGGGAGSRPRRPRPARLVPHRLRQDRGLRPAARRDAARRGAGLRRGGHAAGARHRAHPGAGRAGAARALLAPRRRRRAGRLHRRRHGPAARGPGARRRRPRGGGHAGAAARPHRAQEPRPLARCRRWCSTRPTRCSTWASARSWRPSWAPRPPSGAPCSSRPPSPAPSSSWPSTTPATRRGSPPRRRARPTPTSRSTATWWRSASGSTRS